MCKGALHLVSVWADSGTTRGFASAFSPAGMSASHPLICFGIADSSASVLSLCTCMTRKHHVDMGIL